MALVNFANLDFDQIKTSIKDYLRSNSNFTDYDFEGSNLSTIIDTLAYNTYITSYNANMVSNEVFIDSATLRENVVSLARNIGYTPRSKKSARATISFFVDTSNLSNVPTQLTLKAGTVCTTRTFNVESYSFTIPADITVPVVNNIAEFDNIVVYEGTRVTENFTVSSFNNNQRFILGNAGIDTSTLSVIVKPNENSTVTRTYKLADSLFDVKSDSAVYYIQEVEDERYEIIFGDGIFGNRLQEPDFIEVSYNVTNGVDANGLSSFVFSGKIIDQADRIVQGGISLITTINESSLGSSIESVESVKKYSTQIFASRNRAVTAADYEALIPLVYPETESVSAYGGEEVTPPQFGKVFISVKPYNNRYISNLVKDNIKRELKKYSVAGIVPEIIDLKYLFIEVDSNVYYNSNLTTSNESVKSTILSNITAYSDSTELNRFGARFKYSKFLNLIDSSHDSVTSNITNIVMRRDMRAELNSFADYEICFGNRFHIKNHGHGTHGGQIGYNIKSSAFSVNGIGGSVYFADVPNSGLKTGSLNLIRLISPTEAKIVRKNVGTIDYVKGEIKIYPINITSTALDKGVPTIEISAYPYSNDVIGLQDLYLQLDTSNMMINMLSDGISSGSDISGSNYEVSSSYSNGSLVRGPILVSTTNTTTTTTNTTTTAPTFSTSTATSTTGSTVVSTTSSSPTPTPTPSPSPSPSSGGGGYTY
tara:strand:- start:904 stop:3027 length:2124 start_codon:yes stop_codon:yes gene_type:complete